jgi:uncharacterized repeat protein (TIGR01451 family)
LTDNPLPRFNVYSYKYIFNLRDLDPGTIDRWHEDLVLGIEDIANKTSNDNWKLVNLNKNLSGSMLTFAVNFTDIFKKEFLGEPKYRLYDNGKILEESKGPKIDFVFRYEKSEKKSNGVYNYSVEVRSSINNSTIYILHHDRKGRWGLYNVTKTYVSNNSSWKLLEWVGAPYFYRMEFVPQGYIDDISPEYSEDQVEEIGEISSRPSNEAERNELIVAQTFLEDSVNLQANYTIFVRNIGDIKIKQINISDVLPPNMTFISSSYEHIQDGILMPPNEQYNSDGTTTLDWNIGDLVSDQEKSIKLKVKYMSGLNLDRNSFKATGSILGASISATSNEAIPVQEDA